MRFSDIPVRSYGVTNPSWWNSLRLAGLALENYLGGFFLQETSFTIANNQSSPADVTDLVFDPTEVRSFEASYSLYRNTTGGGATELAEEGTLRGVFSTVADSWQLAQECVGDAGVDFSITTLGQVQYVSSNITGTADESVMKFKATTTGV